MSKKFQYDHILVMVLRLLISTQLTPLVKINHRSKLSKTFFDINETAAPVSTNICIQNNFIDAFANQQEPVRDNSRMLPCDRIGDLVNTSGTELRSQGHSDADLIKLIIRFSGRK